jgi:Family of unknown function (DUF5302)
MSTTPEDQTEPAAAAAASPDDLREKFRAALDRKHGRGTDSAGDAASGASGGSKASARTSNSKRHREFRRKSGG